MVIDVDMKRYAILALVIMAMVLAAAAQAAPVAPVHVLYVEGQIDPAIADYIEAGIENAEEDAAQAVLIVMDTPGGLISSTQKIVKTFFASKVPVIVYVHPSGAWAASAGALIAMAADVAAMSPATNIGASTPVSVSPGGDTQQQDEAMKKKQVNFTAEYAKSIAERRGRNTDWAEAAVREAATLTANEALQKNVVDHVADNIPQLMSKIDGNTIKLAAGGQVTLRTESAPLERMPMGAWQTFLHYLANPYVVLFLSLIAMYGIIYELANPGSIFPGVLGAVAVILLLYSYSVIPINAAGFAFIGLAVILFIVELFTPTYGILSIGGVVSLFFGLRMLFGATEGFMVSLWALAAVAILTGAFFLFVVSIGVRALRNPYVSGREGVVGHVGEARTDLAPMGRIFVDGSLWTATSEEGNIAKGEKVQVMDMQGLKLTVRKYPEG